MLIINGVAKRAMRLRRRANLLLSGSGLIFIQARVTSDNLETDSSTAPAARSLRKSIFFAGRKFLTPINHDYLTEASPGGQYILLTKSHVGSRAHFFLLGCRVLHF